MKGKFNTKKIYKSILDFIKNNRLFILFIVLSMLIGLFLRVNTVSRLVFKALVCDFFIALIVGSFAYLLKVKTRYTYYLIWLFFFSGIAIGNEIYYGFYQSFLSVNLLSTASMVGQVNDSLFAKLHFNQFLYLIFPIIFIIINIILNKTKYYEKVNVDNSKKIFKNLYKVIGVLFVILTCTVSASDGSRFIKLWNRESVVKKYGIYVYTINDMFQSIRPSINTLFGYDEAAAKFRNYYACKWEEKKERNEYTDIFKGKNVLFIHAESIQSFLVDLKINGKEVIPNINKFAKEGIYFSKFYPQISVGTSSDTEFSLLTGLMPSSSGTVFVNYYDRKYYGMPYYFQGLGYYTFSAHANNREYWNREIMHKNLGYKDFYAKDNFIIPVDEDDENYIGLGLSDKEFFNQLIPIYKTIKENKSPFFGTIITLSNHSPFNDVDKYGEFDVSMSYEYLDKNGKKQKGKAPYLEGTPMGNYIKSSHYADSAFGELIENLKKDNLLDNTIIIFYGDHEARQSKKEFDRLYNYDPINNGIIDKEDENYVNVYSYTYELLKNTPLIIWSNDKEFNLKIEETMGMYDVLPTIANMFGFEEKYSLGHDIFSDKENIVVFPNGNVLTDKVYYSDSNDEYIAFTEDPINRDYIDRIREYADKVLDVSNGIVTHDLIREEESRIGECSHE
ncbi:MAG: sulfatase-like hydrolase/transferase [Bacilli bacterium]|nr:sulfatase-like hydrolase/transferase [Bacilli bacterium]